MESNEIKISIKIKTMDMFWFFIKHFYSSFSGIFGIFLSSAALVLLLLSIGKRDSFQLLILLVLASLFTVIQPLQFLMKAYQQVKLLPVYKEPIEYTLDDVGIHVKQNEEHIDLPWENVYKVTESGKGMYIYTSAVHSFIFPKEQLGTDLKAVKSLLKEKVQDDKCKLK